MAPDNQESIHANTDDRHRKVAVLVVDDDEQVVRTLENQLKPLGVSTDGVRNGHDAMRALSEREFAVVIADERMPGISGTELIAWARANRPHVARVMITGQLDFETALAAINTGEVFRFVPKPWTGNQIRDVVMAAIEQYEIKAENERLLDELQRANTALTDLNNSLQHRVADATRSLAQALDELEGSFDGTLQLISSLMGMGQPKITDHCQRTRTHVRRVAETLGLKDPWISHLDLAALCHWIGLINAPPEIFKCSFRELDPDLRAVWEFHPVLGSMVLSTVPALADVAEVVAEYLEPPSHDLFITSPELWTARQILHVSSRFEHVRTVSSASAEVAWADAIAEVERARRTEISADVLDTFLAGLPSAATVAERCIHSVDDLRSGMLLKRTITTGNSVPVAPEGTIVTRDLVRRLRAFEATTGLSEIWVSA